MLNLDQIFAPEAKFVEWQLDGSRPFTLANGIGSLDVNKVLAKLVPGYSTQQFSAQSVEEDSILAQLSQKGLAARSENGWALTDLGRKSLIPCGEVHSCRSVADLRQNVEVADKTTYELILSLQQTGWQHRHYNAGKGAPRLPAYIPGTSDKAFYTRNRSTAALREYLLCLVSADAHNWQVPHMASKRVYLKIMGAGSLPTISHLEDEFELFEHESEQHVKRPGPAVLQLRQKRKRADLVRAQDSSSSSGEDDTRANWGSLSGMPVPEEAFPAAGSALAPSGGSGSSASSPAANSALVATGGGPSSSSSAYASQPCAKSGPPRPAARGQNPTNLHWGPCIFTLKVSAAGQRSWQARRPRRISHRAVGQSSKTVCSKTLAVSPQQDEETVLWRLRRWCNVCFDYPTKALHMAYASPIEDVDLDVALASKAGLFFPGVCCKLFCILHNIFTDTKQVPSDYDTADEAGSDGESSLSSSASDR